MSSNKPPIHNEPETEYNGTLRKIKQYSDVKVGMVLREVNPDGTVAPFSDMVVFNITYSRNAWDTWTHFHLARPSVLVHAGKALTNTEVRVTTDLDYHRIVLDAKGEPIILKVG